jgi:hypothetical protein
LVCTTIQKIHISFFKEKKTMKRSLIFLIVLLSFALSACTASEVVPQGAPAPTSAPISASTVVPTATPFQCEKVNHLVYLSKNEVMYYQVSRDLPSEFSEAIRNYLFDGGWELTSYTDIFGVAHYCGSADKGFYKTVHRNVNGSWEALIVIYNADGKKVGNFKAFRWNEGQIEEIPSWDPGV